MAALVYCWSSGFVQAGLRGHVRCRTLSQMLTDLLDGPSIVVADEAHTIRNAKVQRAGGGDVVAQAGWR